MHFYRLKVRQNSKAAAGIQSLNGLWQVFSCFSQLTSCSHTAIKWIRRELHHIMPTVIKDWTFFCSELSCLPVTLSFTLSSFSVRVSQHLGIIGANLGCSSFLSMPCNGNTWNYRLQYCYRRHGVSEHSMHIYLRSMGLNHLFSPTQCVASIAVP